MTNKKLLFKFVRKDQVREVIMNLDISKATPIGEVSVDILKSTVDILLPFITNSKNLSIEKGCFPEELKLAEVSPIFKKKDDLDKPNYRPVSVLPHVPKVFERIMYHQINDYMKDKLSKQLTGFRKNHSTQHCLSCMLEIWKKVLDKGYICAIFMDLSKASHTLNHDLLIAKLGAYGFETSALIYIKSYFTNRKQRVRVNKTFNEWERITTGVPQGSISGRLLFNIFLNDLVLFISNSSLNNYADDNTQYTFGDSLKKIKDSLWNSFDTVHQCFYDNFTEFNAGKCHFMCFGNNTENETFLFHNILMENSKEQKILNVAIDNQLNFKSHVSELCRKFSQKFAALFTIIH